MNPKIKKLVIKLAVILILMICLCAITWIRWGNDIKNYLNPFYGVCDISYPPDIH